MITGSVCAVGVLVMAGCVNTNRPNGAANHDAAGPLGHRQRVESNGRKYTFTKAVVGGAIQERILDEQGRVLAGNEVDALERALWERTRAPRVAPEVRASLASGAEADVVVYTRGSDDAIPSVARALGLDPAGTHAGPLPGSFVVRVTSERLAALAQAVDTGQIAGLDIPRRSYKNGPTPLSWNESVSDVIKWVRQDRAAQRAGYPADVPPGAPPTGYSNVAVFWECLDTDYLSRIGPLPTLASNQPCINDHNHGESIANILDKFLMNPAGDARHSGPFTYQIIFPDTSPSYDPLRTLHNWLPLQERAGNPKVDQVGVISMSNSEVADGSGLAVISETDRAIDRSVTALDRTGNISWIQSAGNWIPDARNMTGDYVHHLGFNTLKTAIALRNTDQTYYFLGSVKNPPSPHGDRELPEISAPGYSTNSNYVNIGSSFAVPVLAGIAATLQSRSPLSRNPEAVRALLLMSAQKQPGAVSWIQAVTGIPNGYGAPTTAPVDLADGAGVVDAWDAMQGAMAPVYWYEAPNQSFTANGSHGFFSGVLSSGPCTDRVDGCRVDRDTPVTILFPRGQGRVRLALAWSVDDAVHDDPTRWLDLDLVLIDDQGQTVAASMTYDNNYEIIDTHVDPARTYQLRVLKRPGTVTFPNNNYGTRSYAVAWHTEHDPAQFCTGQTACAP